MLKVLKPIPATQGIVAAFKEHPVIIIGEAHWLWRAGDFYIQLVRDPEFQSTVQDIVVEFASRNNQPLLDRYISGEDVPIQDVRRIWARHYESRLLGVANRNITMLWRHAYRDCDGPHVA